MLEINNISKVYSKNGKSFMALDKVSFTVEKGEFVAVLGASGSGKSTLLHTIGGLIHPDSGQVLFKGKDIYTLDNKASYNYLRQNVGFVFQQFHLLPYLTVYENIRMGETELSDQQNIEDYLEKCGIHSLQHKYPSELSVGEKQRTAFIRAIISKPDMLLADEPTGNLDAENTRIIMSLMESFHENGGTVLLVSHDSETSKFANRTITLNSGKLGTGINP
jgi:ABC-type lipoprotein export system ATPase subunit